MVICRFRNRKISVGLEADDEFPTTPPLRSHCPPTLPVISPAAAPSVLKDDALLPSGPYIIVTWDVESTGLTLNDEICQIGAFCPGPGKFNSYIMPSRDVGHLATEIHDFWVLRNPSESQGGLDDQSFVLIACELSDPVSLF